jgi:hypothetical protein
MFRVEPSLEKVYVVPPIMMGSAVLSGSVADEICEPDSMMITPLGPCARLGVVA